MHKPCPSLHRDLLVPPDLGHGLDFGFEPFAKLGRAQGTRLCTRRVQALTHLGQSVGRPLAADSQKGLGG